MHLSISSNSNYYGPNPSGIPWRPILQWWAGESQAPNMRSYSSSYFIAPSVGSPSKSPVSMVPHGSPVNSCSSLSSSNHGSYFTGTVGLRGVIANVISTVGPPYLAVPTKLHHAPLLSLFFVALCKLKWSCDWAMTLRVGGDCHLDPKFKSHVLQKLAGGNVLQGL